jgi:polysaccharide biosynthesis transport protein
MATYLPKQYLPELPEMISKREQAVGGTSLVDWLLRVNRNRGKILVGATAAVGVVFAIYWYIPPIYTAEAMIIIETREVKVVDIDPVLQRLPRDDLVTEGEVQVLRSRDLARKVVAMLGLKDDPEFAEPVEEQLSPFSFWFRSASSLLLASVLATDGPDHEAAGRQRDPDVSRAAVGDDKRESRLLDRFQQRLKADPMGRSRVIKISFTAKNPNTAARIANTVAQVYIDNQIEAKALANMEARDWVESNVARLQEKVRTAEMNAAEFREKSGITLGRSEREIHQRQISELSEQLIAAQSDRATMEARLAETSRAYAARPTAPAAMQAFDTIVLKTLFERQADLASKVAGIENEHGSKHPAFLRASSELANIRAAIQAEGNRIVAGAKSDLAVAQEREVQLKERLKQLRQNINAISAAAIKLDALDREAEASRMLLETFISRSKESELGIQVEVPDTSIISHAAAPTLPSFPDMRVMLPVVFICYGAIVVFALVVARHLDTGFRSRDQLEADGLHTFGLVPLIKRSFGARLGVQRSRTAAAFDEAIQALRASLDCVPQRAGTKVLLVTSSLPMEGKSTLALALAGMETIQGRRALLIDCDFRSPGRISLRERYQSAGLMEYLQGRNSLQDIVCEDPATGLSLIPAGNGDPVYAPLLSSSAMQLLLAAARREYNLVILDSAPIMVVADALRLSPYVDQTVFAVRWARTRRETVLRGMRMLSQAGSCGIGVALTMIDVKMHAKYNFSDSGCFSQKMDEYYGTGGNKVILPVTNRA